MYMYVSQENNKDSKMPLDLLISLGGEIMFLRLDSVILIWS